jgi:hypothetical protein
VSRSAPLQKNIYRQKIPYISFSTSYTANPNKLRTTTPLKKDNMNFIINLLKDEQKLAKSYVKRSPKSANSPIVSMAVKNFYADKSINNHLFSVIRIVTLIEMRCKMPLARRLICLLKNHSACVQRHDSGYKVRRKLRYS